MSEQAKVAAEWWRDAVKDPEFNAVGDMGSIQERLLAKMAAMMARSQVKTVGVKHFEAFAAGLEKTLDGMLDDGGAELGCEFWPDAVLAAEARAAGIPLENFPWMTEMHLRADGSVDVSCGHGAPYVCIRVPDEA